MLELAVVAAAPRTEPVAAEADAATGPATDAATTTAEIAAVTVNLRVMRRPFP